MCILIADDNHNNLHLLERLRHRLHFSSSLCERKPAQTFCISATSFFPRS